MPPRSTAYLLIATASLLVLLLVGLLYGSWSSAHENPQTMNSVLEGATLLTLFLVLQGLIGFTIWWFLRQRQQPPAQTEVLHSIVHEFQTPISAIRMAVDILDSPIARNHPERTEKYVRIIREETERLQHQVETMLTLARADRNTLVLNPEPVHLQHLLRSVAERHGDYLTLQLVAKDTYILADRLHLTNVLYNLLDNAIKYSADDPVITLLTKTDTDGLTITIKDKGVGIPPKLVANIFQPFFRVHDRNQPSVKGFGLGLSYVQRIVQAHNWSIWVKSAVGQGSEFMIQVPPKSILPSTEQG